MSATVTITIILVWMLINLVGVVYGLAALGPATRDARRAQSRHRPGSPERIYSARQRVKIALLTSAAGINLVAGAVSAVFPARDYGNWARWAVLGGLILGAAGTDLTLVLINRTRIQIARAVEREEQEQK